MKRRLLIIILLFCVILPQIESGYAAATPGVHANSAILMEAATGKILYSKNAWAIMAPASTTKIMTAILALERVSLDKTVRICPVAAAKEGTSMDLVNREQKTMRELLYGMLLVSGNDAATAIAEAVSGSEANFVQLMNQKAKQLGMKNTRFLNASGLPDIGHYTTAYDMAILTRYALKNEDFAKIVDTKVKEVTGAKPGTNRTLINHNKLLWRYPYTIGVKTGYTRTAGGCLVSAANRNGVKLISVILKSSSIYDDSKELFTYGFNTISSKSKIAIISNKKTAEI
ncbi:MAG TPA: D-alanyl-D-alanine carboxypeptidase family protein [Bacillota bacterium]|nr:D-alanyl-D-alanine carboxypeptidase family protein [Bacillota bacterium]